jgi:hypothetical protein
MIHVASLFNQLLRHFPRTGFGALVKENDAERGAQGSVSRTSSSPLTRPPCRCVWSCFRGPSFAGPKAVSRLAFCWTMTITCRATSGSLKPNVAM